MQMNCTLNKENIRTRIEKGENKKQEIIAGKGGI